jgi:hypothetical protein
MSLDVYLYNVNKCPHFAGEQPERTQVFSRNITHNLTKMAEALGVYQVVWRPDEAGVLKAGDLIDPLRAAMSAITKDPDVYRQYEAPNGGGRVVHFRDFLREYLAACRNNPNALVEVSR